VHRATIQRWLKEPDFLVPGLEAQPDSGFGTLVPKAMRVLDDALEGKKITNAQIRAALEVVKASNALKTMDQGGASLADLIAQLDEEDSVSDSD
jgi:hypothetical protein